jgi:hypothetical protein
MDYVMFVEAIVCPPLLKPVLLVFTSIEFDRAKKFIFRKWCERAVERGDSPPMDLSHSCKYGSLFMRLVFGGVIEGNYQHQYNMIDGQIVDLSHDAADVLAMREPYYHEAELFGIDEHLASMESCRTRVEAWVTEFMEMDRLN